MGIKRTAQDRIGHYLATEESTLLECLVRHFGLTSEESARLVSFGAVYQDRRRVTSDRDLSLGQYIRVHFDPKRFPVGGIDWRATVIHDDEEFVVANKPPEIPVHATVDNQRENVACQLSAALDTSLYVTQRLDVAVGGLIVFAKTPEFQREFNRLLVERKVKKRYRALVTSAPAVGRHIHYMEPSERSPKTVVAEPQPDWLECALRVLRVTAVGSVVGSRFELEIDLETGRTHQIRAQLSAMGSPILGDKLYGSQTPWQSGIALFSAEASWSYPEHTQRSFQLSPPWQLPIT